MLTVGSQGPYEWFVTDQQFDLLQICPEIVLGKYVAVTSIDIGVFAPNEKEKAAGWESRAKIAYRPRIQNADELPHAGWDEWYIFDNPTDLGTSHLADNFTRSRETAVGNSLPSEVSVPRFRTRSLSPSFRNSTLKVGT